MKTIAEVVKLFEPVDSMIVRLKINRSPGYITARVEFHNSCWEKFRRLQSRIAAGPENHVFNTQIDSTNLYIAFDEML